MGISVYLFRHAPIRQPSSESPNGQRQDEPVRGFRFQSTRWDRLEYAVVAVESNHVSDLYLARISAASFRHDPTGYSDSMISKMFGLNAERGRRGLTRIIILCRKNGVRCWATSVPDYCRTAHGPKRPLSIFYPIVLKEAALGAELGGVAGSITGLGPVFLRCHLPATSTSLLTPARFPVV